MLNELELTGRADTHVVPWEDAGVKVHRDAVNPLIALKTAAAGAGIDLQVVSGYRDFAAQLRIWNMKYRGERPLYDQAGNTVDHARLAVGELIDGILCWSALPGASRHHWGTDVDVIDRAVLGEDGRFHLVPDEYAEGGVFHRMRTWLDGNAAEFGFFFPYADYRGGIYPEPWHLSHAALSSAALDLLTPELVAAAVREADVLGKEHVLARLPDIYRRYVANISTPYVIEPPSAAA